MKQIRNLLADLVDRRLWPVALVLVAAIVAVPVLLSSKGSAEPADTAAATPAADATKLPAGSSAVADTSVVATTASGRALRSSKAVDPFVYRGPKAKADKAAGPATGGASGPSTGSSSSSSSVGGSSSNGSGFSFKTSLSTSGGSSGGGSPATTPGATKKPSYAAANVRVRFGKIDTNRKVRGVSRLSALPSSTNPVLIYMGVRKGTKTAVFLVSSDAQAEGDGSCKPKPSSCQTIWIKEGQTEFLDVTSDTGTVTQYQLDVVDVAYSKTQSRAKAASTFLQVAPHTTKVAKSDPASESAGASAQTRPTLGDLEWSGKLKTVLGVPAPTKDDGDAAPRPVVVGVPADAGGVETGLLDFRLRPDGAKHAITLGAATAAR